MTDVFLQGELSELGAGRSPGSGAGRESQRSATVRAREFGAYLLRRPGLVLAALVLITVLLWAFVPDLFTSQSPLLGTPADKLAPPSASHWMGTDELGRDEYSRVVHGTALTLQATLIAVLIGLVIGSAIGLFSGCAGGRVDDVLMRIVDVMLSVPSLIIALAIVAALGFGTEHVAIAVGVANVAGFARVMRSEVLRISAATYVEAGRTAGSSWFTVLRRHVLPNTVGPVLVLAALEFGQAVLAVASLSFLGLGAQPPAPEWGELIADGRSYLATSWWLTTLPGLVVALTVLSANRVARAVEGEGTRR